MINTSPREISCNLISVRSSTSKLIRNHTTSLILLNVSPAYTTGRLYHNNASSIAYLTLDDSYIVTTLISTVIISTTIYSLNFTKNYNSMYVGLYL